MQISSLKSNNQSKNSNTKRYILIGLIASVVLLILLLIMLVLFSNMTPQNLTLAVNGQTVGFAQDTFIFEDNKIYVSLRDVSNLIEYRYYDGKYNEFSEDKSSCYLESDDEVVVFELGKDTIYKTLKNGNIKYSEFKIAEPIKMYNNKLYCIATALRVSCNLEIAYNQQTNQIIINTLSNLYNTYNDKAVAKEYANVEALDENFINKKAIIYGMLVVKDKAKEQARYGVISLDGNKTYLGIKYDEIEFVENLQQFIVKGDNRYGVIAVTEKDGVKDVTQKIKSEYSNIKVLDYINSLYYAEKNGKKGVLDKDGNALGDQLYVEYDQIGIDTKLFPNDNIENSMLIYDNCIPVKRGEKWGIFNKEGELISDFNWDSLGYVVKDNNQSTRDNLLLVNELDGIIVCRDEKYGVVDSNGDLVVACIFDKIYTEIIGGEEIYYFQYGNNVISLDDYLELNRQNDDQNQDNKQTQSNDNKNQDNNKTQNNDDQNQDNNQTQNDDNQNQDNNQMQDDDNQIYNDDNQMSEDN